MSKSKGWVHTDTAGKYAIRSGKTLKGRGTVFILEDNGSFYLRLVNKGNESAFTFRAYSSLDNAYRAAKRRLKYIDLLNKVSEVK